jgi:acetylornithine deacetylase/succinyl-diaminopimelate desuccinylase-like protein
MTDEPGPVWDLEDALVRARDGRGAAVDSLLELVRIPSVSTLPEHGPDVRRAADWIAGRLRSLGMTVEVVDGDPHPVIAGEWLGRSGASTLAIYSHYDVQPAAPLEAWTSPPFEPAIRDDFIYGRGARDDKSQLVAGLVALEHAFATGGPPLNIRVFYEGEEETVGPSLARFLHANAERLPTDYALIVDGQWLAPGVPAIVTGLRGVLHVAIEVTGASSDLHSGLFGGVAPNALNSLSHILSGLKDRDGRVTIPGYYDEVLPPTDAERAGWATAPVDERAILQDVGSSALEGESGYSALERIGARPTLDVHGIVGGHQEEGIKTVIPGRATAKVSMRLVPDQDPERVFEAVKTRVQELATDGVSVKVSWLAQCRPMRFGTHHAGVEAARRGLSRVFGVDAVLIRNGGSIPVTDAFQAALDPAMIVLGFGLPGDNNHAPDEHFSLAQFHGATETMLVVMDELAASPPATTTGHQ